MRISGGRGAEIVVAVDHHSINSRLLIQSRNRFQSGVVVSTAAARQTGEEAVREVRHVEIAVGGSITKFVIVDHARLVVRAVCIWSGNSVVRIWSAACRIN